MDAMTRTHIRLRRSEIIRSGLKRQRVVIDFEKEVEDAIAHFRRTGPWPPQVQVPKAALSAVD